MNPNPNIAANAAGAAIAAATANIGPVALAANVTDPANVRVNAGEEEVSTRPVDIYPDF